MDTESKLNTLSDLSEQTNHTSVIHTDNVTLSEPAVKKIKKSETKELEEDAGDRDGKKKRKVSRYFFLSFVVNIFDLFLLTFHITGQQRQKS